MWVSGPPWSMIDDNRESAGLHLSVDLRLPLMDESWGTDHKRGSAGHQTCACVCVCVCVCVHMYVYVCMCVCMCIYHAYMFVGCCLATKNLKA